VSGYSGGKYPNPTYREICEGESGHAEVIEISFNEHQISVEDLLLIFFHTHDPTTLNRQGNDMGTQYRSVIFYANENQKVAAEKLMTQLGKEQIFESPVVTELSPLKSFYPAEAYHQDYFNQNSYQPYCSVVVAPKLKKFLEKFQEKIKPN
jgi:peptide-methionine (S)-S-oxide reductase